MATIILPSCTEPKYKAMGGSIWCWETFKSAGMLLWVPWFLSLHIQRPGKCQQMPSGCQAIKFFLPLFSSPDTVSARIITSYKGLVTVLELWIGRRALMGFSQDERLDSSRLCSSVRVSCVQVSRHLQPACWHPHSRAPPWVRCSRSGGDQRIPVSDTFSGWGQTLKSTCPCSQWWTILGSHCEPYIVPVAFPSVNSLALLSSERNMAVCRKIAAIKGLPIWFF